MNEVPSSPDVRIVPCPGGPLLVRGAQEVVDAAGVAHPVTRPVVAVCACDRSQRQPWCDSTHKALERGRRRHEGSETGSTPDRTHGMDVMESEGHDASASERD